MSVGLSIHTIPQASAMEQGVFLYLHTNIMESVIAGTTIEPYITGDYVGHFVYASPSSEDILYWPPSMIQFA